VKALGLPRAIRTLFARSNQAGALSHGARILRFDFHWTREGWRVSEVNSDVPGGFAEASIFTALIAEHGGSAHPVGSPLDRWTEAIARAAATPGAIAVLSAPGFMEDLQIAELLTRRLRALGREAYCAVPRQISWAKGRARLNLAWYEGPVSAIVRFYQAEWLASLPASMGWRELFTSVAPPVLNPGSSILTESKRLPLVWNALDAAAPTWRALLPESRDPREVRWKDDGWVMKQAFCNTGDTVLVYPRLARSDQRGLALDVALRPGSWVAQRRFDPVGIETPAGLLYPCLGVYTVDGAAVGVYARASASGVTDGSALDLALLVEPPHADREAPRQEGHRVS
jgi:glutathionylspermidine synthase